MKKQTSTSHEVQLAKTNYMQKSRINDKTPSTQMTSITQHDVPQPFALNMQVHAAACQGERSSYMEQSRPHSDYNSSPVNQKKVAFSYLPSAKSRPAKRLPATEPQNVEKRVGKKRLQSPVPTKIKTQAENLHQTVLSGQSQLTNDND